VVSVEIFIDIILRAELLGWDRQSPKQK